MSLNFEEIYSFAKTLAREAGDMILAASQGRSLDNATTQSDSSKKNRVDLVTETDQAVEKFVLQRVSAQYPEHKFIGEESFAAGERGTLTDEPTWIIDPIDGTTNFVHGFDHCCISVGFAYKRQPVIGVIYNPFLSKLYSGLKGSGSYVTHTITNQSTRLPLSHPNPPPFPNLSDGLVAVEWGSDRSERVMEAKALGFKRLAADGKDIPGGKMVHSLRSIGSAALNYAYVATGQMDAYWEIGCWSWDVCAGTIIALEAGCQVFGKSGKKWEDQDLMDHYYFVIRAIGDTFTEKGADAQERITKEFFETIEEWDI